MCERSICSSRVQYAQSGWQQAYLLFSGTIFGIIFNSSDDITLVAGFSFNKLVMRAFPVASSPVGSLTGVMNGTSSGGVRQSLKIDR